VSEQAYDAAAPAVDAANEEPAAVRRVRAAQATLDDLDGVPLSDQIETYDDVHSTLQDALAELDGA
jgi:hypothetical protein